jgi:hypothetical protein
MYLQEDTPHPYLLRDFLPSLTRSVPADPKKCTPAQDELYYQRFMGMNEGEPTDELRLAAEIADMDPSTIDSLRRGTPAASAEQQGQAPSRSFGGMGQQQQPPATQQPPPPFGSRPGSIGGAAGGFLNSVKKAATGSTGGGTSFVPLVNGGAEQDMMMSGPRAYVIPQDDRETPLEIRSVPTPRRSQKGVIAEVPGRRLPKRPGRVDLGEKMAEVKRTLKEAPTRLTEMQVQNLRNNMGPGGGSTTTATPPNANQQGNKDAGASNPPFSFPSFPVQLPTQQPQQQQTRGPAQSPFAGVGGGPSSSGSSGRRGLKRRGTWGAGSGRPSQKSSLPAWSRDWRVWVGAIAAVSFLGALINALGARSELIVMDSASRAVGAQAGVADFLLQNAADLGADMDKLFV